MNKKPDMVFVVFTVFVMSVLASALPKAPCSSTAAPTDADLR